MPSKLTQSERAAMNEEWKYGTSPKELAEKYGVSVTTVYKNITRMNASMDTLTKESPKAANEDEKTTDAEQVAEVREEFVETLQKLPEVIWNALDDQVHAINLEIEEREQRIAELKEELVQLEDKRYAIEQWMEEHT